MFKAARVSSSEVATEVERRRPAAGARPSRPSRPSLEHNTTVTSPIEALQLADIARMRVFFRVVIIITTSGIITAVAAHGDPIAQRVVIVGSLASLCAGLWILRVTRGVARFDPVRVAIASVPVIGGAITGVYYWGILSPVCAMLVYGIYFFGLGVERLLINCAYGLIAISHAILMALVYGGVIEDRGVMRMVDLRWDHQLTLFGIIEFLYFVSYATARLSQQATLDSVAKLEQAVRGIAHREAMLAEARAELDRAQVIGGPGRYTDQTIGAYHLDVLIGRGAMGEIYQARSTLTGAEAAVKLLHPTALGDPMYVKRFLREAQAAASIVSPNVVRVFDIGTTDAEVPYIAMERLYGQDLATEIRTRGYLSVSDVRTLVSQIAVGLEAARAKEIVHRDLKPHNVFGVVDGVARTWKILDFGVSKMNSSGTLTEGHIVGTPAYMAPEQARGQEVDHRADVYALAAIAFRALTGRPVFSGKDVPSTLYDVVYRPLPQASKIRVLPADVDRFFAVGLAKDPDRRFSTALELADWFAAAETNQLSDAQRQRADQLIASSPWDREV